MGVASLVLGIISLILGFIPGTSLIGIVGAIIAVVLGALGRGNEASKGLATGGLVCGIIALVLCGVAYFACGGAALCAACSAATTL